MSNKATDKQVGGNHYKKFAIQPITFINANSIPFMEANVIKYTMRHTFKNGIQDIEKAIHYLELIKEHYYPQENENNTKADSK